MRFSTFFAAIAATAASAHSLKSERSVARNWCGTKAPSANQIEQSRQLSLTEVRDDSASFRALARSPYVVDVYFHVIALNTDSEEDGWLTNSTLAAQFDVMNKDFEPMGFQFVLKGTTYTVPPEWAYDQDELAYKKTLRRGDYGTLNVYFLPGLLNVGLLGYATFPDNYVVGTNDFYLDGIVIASQSTPGGSAAGFNLGRTVTHEAGHWFNLYHTFQGGCEGDGDFVRDTPAQASPSSGCPVGRDSCPGKRGLDPIHNYMDYSDDACYNEFTSGQRRRTHSSWRQYRK